MYIYQKIKIEKLTFIFLVISKFSVLLDPWCLLDADDDLNESTFRYLIWSSFSLLNSWFNFLTVWGINFSRCRFTFNVSSLFLALKKIQGSN